MIAVQFQHKSIAVQKSRKLLNIAILCTYLRTIYLYRREKKMLDNFSGFDRTISSTITISFTEKKQI